MTEKPQFTAEHCLVDEDEALALIGEHRTRLGGRVLDPKAQVLAEFINTIRVPGYFPPLPELRQQLVTMTQLLDEPCPALRRKEDMSAPGPAGDIPARLYCDAAEGANPPILAYFHGGGWVQGDLNTHDGLCGRLAQFSGAMVVAFDYRLAPENPYPAAVEDCIAAYTWLRHNGADLGGDPSRVAVAGDSAGGNLSAVVCQQAPRDGVAMPDFQVLIYPATDMTADTPSHAELPHAPVIPRDRIDWYLQQYIPAGTDIKDPRLSPLHAADVAGQPPALIISGGFDPLRDEAKYYADKLTAAGCDVVHHEYPGQIHAFVSLVKAIPQGMAATREIADYMRRQFG